MPTRQHSASNTTSKGDHQRACCAPKRAARPRVVTRVPVCSLRAPDHPTTSSSQAAWHVRAHARGPRARARAGADWRAARALGGPRQVRTPPAHATASTHSVCARMATHTPPWHQALAEAWARHTNAHTCTHIHARRYRPSHNVSPGAYTPILRHDAHAGQLMLQSMR